MKLRPAVVLLLLLLLTGLSGLTCHAMSDNRPKNLTVRYVTTDGTTVFEKQYTDVSGLTNEIQAYFNREFYLDTFNKEYEVVGFRSEFYANPDYTERILEELSCSNRAELQENIKSQLEADAPSKGLVAVLVLRYTGVQYSTTNDVNVIVLNENSQKIHEEHYTIKAGEILSIKPPEGADFLSVNYAQTDIWKLTNPQEVTGEIVTVRFISTILEHSIVFRVHVTGSTVFEPSGEESVPSGESAASVPEPMSTERHVKESTMVLTPNSTPAGGSKTSAAAGGSSAEGSGSSGHSDDFRGVNRSLMIIITGLILILLLVVLLRAGEQNKRKKKKKNPYGSLK